MRGLRSLRKQKQLRLSTRRGPNTRLLPCKLPLHIQAQRSNPNATHASFHHLIDFVGFHVTTCTQHSTIITQHLPFIKRISPFTTHPPLQPSDLPSLRTSSALVGSPHFGLRTTPTTVLVQRGRSTALHLIRSQRWRGKEGSHTQQGPFCYCICLFSSGYERGVLRWG